MRSSQWKDASLVTGPLLGSEIIYCSRCDPDPLQAEKDKDHAYDRGWDDGYAAAKISVKKKYTMLLQNVLKEIQKRSSEIGKMIQECIDAEEDED